MSTLLINDVYNENVHKNNGREVHEVCDEYGNRRESTENDLAISRLVRDWNKINSAKGKTRFVRTFYSMVNSAGEMYVGNIEAPFGATYYEKTGHKPLIINTAISGTGINVFTPGQTGYAHMVEYWTDAMSKINTDVFDVSIKSYLWIQGESDSSLPVASYCGAFVKMNNALTDPNGEFKLKSAIISQVRTESSANAAEAQEYLSSIWPNIYMGTTLAQTFTETNGLLRDDGLHYTQAGYNKIGVALAVFCAEHST